MAAVAPIEELKACKDELERFKKDSPTAYEWMQSLFDTHRKVGYKNIVKMIYGKTPEELKE